LLRLPTTLLLIIALTLAGSIPVFGEQDEAGSKGNSLFPIKLDGKWGYINQKGEVIIEPQFRFAEDFSEGLAGATTDSGSGLIDSNGEFLVQPRFQKVFSFNEGVAVALERDKAGFIDRDGNWLVSVDRRKLNPRPSRDLEFDRWQFSSFGEGLGGYFDPASGELVFIDNTGKEKMRVQGTDCKGFYEGLCAVRNNDLWGFIDRQGDWRIPPSFRNVRSFSEGLASACVEGEKGKSAWGYIDQDGSWLVEPAFGNAGNFSGGYAPVADRWDRSIKYSGWKYIDRSGRPVTDQVFWRAGTVVNGKALVVEDPGLTYGLLDPAESEVTSLESRSLYWTEDSLILPQGMVRATSNNGWGLVDRDLNLTDLPGVIRPQSEFKSEGWLWAEEAFTKNSIKLDGQGRLIESSTTRQGTPGWKPNYSQLGWSGFRKSADSLAGGLAAFEENGKWGFKNEKGKVVLPAQFDDVTGFWQGLCAARKGYKWGFISPRGIWLIEPQFEIVLDFKEGLAAVRKDDKWGYIDRFGNWIIPPRFDYAGYFCNGLATVGQGRYFEPRHVPLPSERAEWASGTINLQQRRFRYIGHLSLIATYTSDMWVIDRSGEPVSDQRYFNIGCFADGFAPVQVCEEETKHFYWDYINRDCELVTDFRLAAALQFTNGHAIVRIPERVAYYDLDGNVVWSPTY